MEKKIARKWITSIHGNRSTLRVQMKKKKIITILNRLDVFGALGYGEQHLLPIDMQCLVCSREKKTISSQIEIGI